MYTFKIIWTVTHMNALHVLNCWPGNQASGHHLLSDAFRHRRCIRGRLAWRGKLVSPSPELTSPSPIPAFQRWGSGKQQAGNTHCRRGRSQAAAGGRELENRSLRGILAVTVIASRGSTHQYTGSRLPAFAFACFPGGSG